MPKILIVDDEPPIREVIRFALEAADFQALEAGHADEARNQIIAEKTNGQFDELSLQFVLGYLFAPVMWLIGVPGEDMTLMGRLLGEKIIMTEFVGYISLADLKSIGALSNKSIIMATYMLCGFANFASIGIQIGGIGSLAPNQRVLLSKFGMRALLAGTLASLLSATIIGTILS